MAIREEPGKPEKDDQLSADEGQLIFYSLPIRNRNLIDRQCAWTMDLLCAGGHKNRKIIRCPFEWNKRKVCLAFMPMRAKGIHWPTMDCQ